MWESGSHNSTNKDIYQRKNNSTNKDKLECIKLHPSSMKPRHGLMRSINLKYLKIKDFICAKSSHSCTLIIETIAYILQSKLSFK